MTCDVDGNYDIDPADYAASASARRARTYTSEFRPDRRDPNAPITRLITAGDARCVGVGDELWFSNQNKPSELRRLCTSCPLQQPCLDYAITNDVQGFWGGTTYADRQELRKSRRIKAKSVQFFDWIGAT